MGDNFLGAAAAAEMRREAVALWEGGHFQVSQSTRWDRETAQQTVYKKQSVQSMELVGQEQYHAAPLLMQYLVSMVQQLPAHINAQFPQLPYMVASSMTAI